MSNVEQRRENERRFAESYFYILYSTFSILTVFLITIHAKETIYE